MNGMVEEMHYKKHVILGIISLVVLILKNRILNYALYHPVQIEKVYSRGIYPVISKILTSIANVFPFSIGEIIFAVLVLTGLIVLVKMLLLLLKKRVGDTLHLLMLLVLSIVLVLSFFDVAWLLNNYRPDFENLAHLQVESPNKEDLVKTFRVLVLQANNLREGLSESDEQIPNGLTVKEILRTAYKGYGPLSLQYDFFRSDPVMVKGLLSSPIQTMSGYTGVYLFFAGEPAVNIKAPIFTIPHTACHEIAHQQGFAQEEAANYIGFLACKKNPSTFFQYSGYLAAVSYVGSALYLVDQDAYFDVTKLYSPKVRGDMRVDQEFWDKHEKGTPSKVVDELNDSYLKSYNQEEGIQSYGKFVDLLIADFIEDQSI